jgi:hypothetical protein
MSETLSSCPIKPTHKNERATFKLPVDIYDNAGFSQGPCPSFCRVICLYNEGKCLLKEKGIKGMNTKIMWKKTQNTYIKRSESGWKGGGGANTLAASLEDALEGNGVACAVVNPV